MSTIFAASGSGGTISNPVFSSGFYSGSFANTDTVLINWVYGGAFNSISTINRGLEITFKQGTSQLGLFRVTADLVGASYTYSGQHTTSQGLTLTYNSFNLGRGGSSMLMYTLTKSS